MSSLTFFFVFIPILALILLIVNFLLAPHKPNKDKDSQFECGFTSFVQMSRMAFTISFFIYALLFLLFDLEILLVYPYVISSYNNDIYGLITMLIFFILLTIGFVYELGKKALDIDSRQTLDFPNANKFVKVSFKNLPTLKDSDSKALISKLISIEIVLLTSTLLGFMGLIYFHITVEPGWLIYIISTTVIELVTVLGTLFAYYGLNITINDKIMNTFIFTRNKFLTFFSFDNIKLFVTCWLLLIFTHIVNNISIPLLMSLSNYVSMTIFVILLSCGYLLYKYNLITIFLGYQLCQTVYQNSNTILHCNNHIFIIIALVGLTNFFLIIFSENKLSETSIHRDECIGITDIIKVVLYMLPIICILRHTLIETSSIFEYFSYKDGLLMLYFFNYTTVRLIGFCVRKYVKNSYLSLKDILTFSFIPDKHTNPGLLVLCVLNTGSLFTLDDILTLNFLQGRFVNDRLLMGIFDITSGEAIYETEIPDLSFPIDRTSPIEDVVSLGYRYDANPQINEGPVDSRNDMWKPYSPIGGVAGVTYVPVSGQRCTSWETYDEAIRLYIDHIIINFRYPVTPLHQSAYERSFGYWNLHPLKSLHDLSSKNYSRNFKHYISNLLNAYFACNNGYSIISDTANYKYHDVHGVATQKTVTADFVVKLAENPDMTPRTILVVTLKRSRGHSFYDAMQMGREYCRANDSLKSVFLLVAERNSVGLFAYIRDIHSRTGFNIKHWATNDLLALYYDVSTDRIKSVNQRQVAWPQVMPFRLYKGDIADHLNISKVLAAITTYPTIESVEVIDNGATRIMTTKNKIDFGRAFDDSRQVD